MKWLTLGLLAAGANLGLIFAAIVTPCGRDPWVFVAGAALAAVVVWGAWPRPVAPPAPLLVEGEARRDG